VTDPANAPCVPTDEELDRLDQLARRFEDDAANVGMLARTVRGLRSGRAGGRSWHDLVDSRRPPALELVDRAVRRITEGGGALRRTLVRGLRAEGATVPGIARVLGVSHQRVSVLLRKDPVLPPAEPPG